MLGRFSSVVCLPLSFAIGGCLADVDVDVNASSGGTTGPVCDPEVGCECLADEDCPAGTVCDGQQCIPLAYCGNGVLDPGEACDGFADILCEDLGYPGGNMECTPDCQLDASGCNPVPACGDGILHPGETCDDGNLTGGDGCSSDCQVENAFLWSETVDVAGGDDIFEGVAVGPDGNVAVTGQAANANPELWIRSYEGNDGLLLLDVVTPSPEGQSTGKGIEVAPDHSFYVAGSILTATTAWDALLRAYDPMGGELWSYQRNGPASSSDALQDVALRPGGEAVFAGFIYGNSYQDAFFGEVQPGGGELWSNKFGSQFDGAYDVALAPDGTMYVVGEEGTPTGKNGFILAYQPGGVLAWSAILDEGGVEKAFGVDLTDSGDIVVVGNNGNDLSFRRFDNGGGLMISTSHSLGITTVATAVAVAPGERVHLVGWVADPMGVRNHMIAELDGMGGLVDSAVMAGAPASSDELLDLALIPVDAASVRLAVSGFVVNGGQKDAFVGVYVP